MDKANICIDYKTFGDNVDYMISVTPIGFAARRMIFGVSNEVAFISRGMLGDLKTLKSLGLPWRFVITPKDVSNPV